MKFREDIGTAVSLLLSFVDGGCSALYINRPQIVAVLFRLTWMSLFTICAIVYIKKDMAKKQAAQATARVARRQQLHDQWIHDYEQFRNEMHAEDRFR